MANRRGSEPRKVEVTALTSTQERNRLTNELDTWKRTNAPGVSIDVLLTRPFESLEMSLRIACKLERISKPTCDELLQLLKTWRTKQPATIAVVNEICARAMNDRKRGLLKPHKQNGATR